MIGVRSLLTALYAGRHGKRAQRLERAGRSKEALDAVRQGLSTMRSSHVIRKNPGEQAILMNLTLFAERLGARLGQPGAAETDVREVLHILETAPARLIAPWAQEHADSVALLRGRLERR